MIRSLTLTQLGYIVALDEHRSFQLAAKACHVTQPTLSQQVLKLEKDLGVMIFDRSKQPVIPTQLGSKIIGQARQVLKQAKSIEDLILLNKGEVAGEFRLGVIPSLSSYLLPLFVPQFTKKYPGVHLTIDECLTDQIIEKLKNDTLDGAILATPLHHDFIQELPLFYEPFWVYVAKQHPLFKQKKLSAGEIDASDLWLLRDGHCFRGQALQLCKKRKGSNPQRIEFEGGSLEVLKSLVDENLGMTLLPDLATRKLVGGKEKENLRPFENPIPVREISIVHSRIFAKRVILEAIKSMILECVPKDLLTKKDRDVLDLK